LQRLGFSSYFYISAYEPPSGDMSDPAPARGAAPPPVNTSPAKTQPAKEPAKEEAKPAPVAQPTKESAKQPVAFAQPAESVKQPVAFAQPAESAKQPVAFAQPAVVNIPPASAPPPPANTTPVTTGIEQKLAANNSIVPATDAGPKAPAINFVKFQDPAVSYSFDRPQTWEGGQLDPKDAKDQNMSAGALFKSAEDTAFITAIWNNLEKANSPEQDNDLMIKLILQSMAADAHNFTEIGRKVVREGGIIKTYIDMQMSFKPQKPRGKPLEFLGKALIAQTNKGILLVAALYWKDAPSHLAGVADRIIASVKTPL
jgi:hypothetical protein